MSIDPAAAANPGGGPAAAISPTGDAAAAAVPAPAAPAAPVTPTDSGYFTGRNIPQDEREWHSQVGAYLQAKEVSPVYGNAALDWLDKNGGKPLEATKGSHTYDLSHFHFPNEDWPYVHAFAVHMKGLGARESDVQHLLRVYEATQRAQRQERAAAPEAAEQEHMLSLFREEYGPRARETFRLVRDYVKTLPAAEREMELDRASLRDLVERAQRASPTAPGKSEAEEFADLRRQMGNRRSEYWRSEKLQARYRALVSKGHR